MIIAYVGGLGSGKTLSAVRWILRTDAFAYTNIVLKGYKRWHRLTYDDLVVYESDDKGKLKAVAVNWNFWKKASKTKNFSIVIDELHNIIHSRNFMSAENKLISSWVSQVRKILYDKAENHLILISQSIHKIDVDVRELINVVIECRCVIRKGRKMIVNTYFDGLDNYFSRLSYCSLYFNASKYYDVYDTNQVVQFEPSRNL